MPPLAASFRLIALVGLRATGKTTLGRDLAQRLGWTFVDADDLLAAHVGCPAGEFLQRAGEPAFRAAERTVLLPCIAEARDTVLATGGGAVLDADVRRGLAAPQVLTVWLRAELSVLSGRLRAGGPLRPPLTGSSPDRELQQLDERRRPLYREVANAVLDTGAASVQACAAQLERWARSGPPYDVVS